MKALPKAKKVKKVLKKHNDSRIDNYYWLRDDTRKNKAVLDYLKTERAYYDDWIKTQSRISKNYLNFSIPIMMTSQLDIRFFFILSNFLLVQHQGF